MKYFSEYNELDAEKEVLRQTERHLEEQHRMASAADQRASAFAAVQIVVIGLLLGSTPSPTIAEGKIVVVLLLSLSVSTAIYSARPTRIFGSGGDEKSLEEYRKPLMHSYLLSTLIERNSRNIDHNNRMLQRSARVFRGSLVASLVAFIVLVCDWMNISELIACLWEG